MKLIKPLKLGLLFRAFEYRGRCFWSPAVLAFFDFSGPPRLKSEVDLWKLAPQRLGQQILDEGMPKARAEVLVNGSFFAPGKKPVPAGKVRVSLGPVDKTLYVFGDRFWKRSAAMAWTMSDPEPVTEVPIDWEHSFGGPEFKPNPLGKGMEETEIPGRGPAVALPNIEYPDQLIASPKDRPAPAGLGPVDLTRPQRFSKCGTYDKKWFEQRFPGLADDIDWTFFNAAPEDQQADGFFSGQESFVIEGMHPDRRRLEGSLPAIRPRCFICRRQTEDKLEELDLKIDTVWLFPDACKGVVIFRGLTEVGDHMAKEVTRVLLAYEKADDPARDPGHYREALEKRLDPQNAGAALLDETDLIGEGETSGIAELLADSGDQDQKWEQLLQKKQRLRMENDIRQVREKIAAQGLDPDNFVPLPPPAEKVDPTDIDKLLKEAENARQKAEQVLEAQLKKAGLTKEEFLKQASEKPAPRPVFSAARAVEIFRTLGIESDEITAKMQMVEKTFFQNYRRYGHLLPPVIPPGPETGEERLRIVTEACRNGTGLADIDLSGLNLSAMDLSGADLAGAFLEGADLSGADLSGADLSNCALMRADLAGAKLTGAKLKGAGLGRARLTGADLTEADLTAASLAEADLEGARFTGAVLNEADLSQARGLRADFSRARIKKVHFIEGDFSEAIFDGADLCEGIFIQAGLAKARFRGSNLAKTTFVKVDAAGADFSQANFDSLRAAAECVFEGARFDGAKMEGANLRGARLAGASFEKAILDRADLSEADLKQASLYHASAKGALFMDTDLTAARLAGANLYESLLHAANLDGTDFTGANLFGADFMKARFRNTDVRHALTAKSTLLRWMPK